MCLLCFTIVITAGGSTIVSLDGNPFNGADFAAYCRDCLRNITTAMVEGGILREGQIEVEMSFLMPQSPHSSHGSRDSFGAAIQTTRSFTTTERGHIGLCPLIAEEVELICVLFGGNMPFLLRPVGDDYRLIGERFVPGPIHGRQSTHGKTGRWQSRRSN